MSICKDCIYSRYACNEEYIACKYVLEYKGFITERILLDTIKAEVIAFGWGDLGRKNKNVEKSGILTNELLCTKNTYKCKWYDYSDI